MEASGDRPPPRVQDPADSARAGLGVRAGAVLAAALILLLAEQFSGVWQPLERVRLLLSSGIPQVVVYLGVVTVLTAALVLVLRARNRVLAFSVAALVALGVSMELAFDVFTGRGFTEDFVAISLRELGMAPEAASAYMDPRAVFAVAAGLILVGLAVVLLRGRRPFGPLISTRAALLALLLLVLLSTAWRLRFGHYNLYPIYLRPAANAVTYYVQQLFIPDREPISVQVREDRFRPQRLVLMVDESVRPDLLSVNGYGQPTTPYLDSISGRLLNLGVATSGSTCSDASNVMLNSWVRPEDVRSRERILTRPTIFAYAKAAGYRTVLLSAVFRSPLFYGIRRSDLEHVDDVVMINELYGDRKELNDHRMVAVLDSLFQAHPDERMFVYMRKQGTHFPFDDYYPEDRRPFEPVLGRKRPMHDHRADLLNSYFNGLRWNLDDFYREMDRQVGDAEALVIYTSDHGENVELNERLLHCGRHPTMAMVPLWLDLRGPSTRDGFLEDRGVEWVHRNRNRVAHGNVFPTLLELMGIESGAPTLFDDLTDQQRSYFPPASHGTYDVIPFDSPSS